MFDKVNIKKVVLWLTVIMVCSFAIAMSIFTAKDVGGTFLKTLDENKQSVHSVNTEKTFAMDGIKDISLSTVSEDVNIIPVDTTEIKAHFYGNSYGTKAAPEMVTERFGDRLVIRINYKPNIGININHGSLKLDVYIPKTYTNSLDVQTVSASIGIKDFQFDTLKCHSVSGYISASNINTKNTSLSTTSGEMRIDGFTGDLDSKSVSGGIDITYTRFSNNVKLSTTSGSMRLKLPEKSEFNINFSSVSGDFKSDIPLSSNGLNKGRNFQGSAGNSNNRINASTVSGDFMIYK